jgi:hypothetical protein
MCNFNKFVFTAIMNKLQEWMCSNMVTPFCWNVVDSNSVHIDFGDHTEYPSPKA